MQEEAIADGAEQGGEAGRRRGCGHGAAPVRVELLYFEGCPNYERLVTRLRALVEELSPGAELTARRIESAEDAQREGFLGSPTVRVDGLDVDPGASKRRDFGLQCRLYRLDGVASPLPPERWLRDALGRRRRSRSVA